VSHVWCWFFIMGTVGVFVTIFLSEKNLLQEKEI
jgi:hypothetical protein